MSPCPNPLLKAPSCPQASHHSLLLPFLISLHTRSLQKRRYMTRTWTIQRQRWGVNTTTQFTEIHLSINWNTCFTHQHLTKTETGNLTIQGNYDQKPTENSKVGLKSLHLFPKYSIADCQLPKLEGKSALLLTYLTTNTHHRHVPFGKYS